MHSTGNESRAENRRMGPSFPVCLTVCTGNDFMTKGSSSWSWRRVAWRQGLLLSWQSWFDRSLLAPSVLKTRVLMNTCCGQRVEQLHVGCHVNPRAGTESREGRLFGSDGFDGFEAHFGLKCKRKS